MTRLAFVTACMILGACARQDSYQPQVPGGDAQRGRIALRQHECGVCHLIPGIHAARGYVGPPLTTFAMNVYVAGKYPNTPAYLVRWIMDAPALAPETAMPALGVTEAEARDMAAYLYTLE